MRERPGGLRWFVAVAVAGAVAALTACTGGSASDGAAATRRRVGSTTVPSAVPVTTPPATASPVERLVGVGDARQVISVVADDYGRSTATLVAYERDATGWRQVLGPWAARVGASGFAPPGQKREGDGRTPTGAYGFDFAFGVLADPGVKLPYRPITSDAIVWNDDPASPRYNLWTDSTAEAAGVDPEPMYNVPAYSYGAVIAYNTARTPGLGSAIFLHVAGAGPTAGCVAVPQDQLVQLLRWLDPAKTPRIVMGTTGAVTS